MNAIDLADRVAIVTGAGGGLGEAVARRLAASGAKVLACDINMARIDRASLPASITCEEVNIADSAAVGALVERFVAREGRLDILVHSAAVLGAAGPVADYPEDEWRRVIDVNLTGTFIVNKAVVPYMSRHGYGRIVNVSSAGGKDGHAMMSAYVSSKAAVIGFTKSLGKEVAGQGIVVNCVTPGAMKTPMGPGTNGVDPAVTARVMALTPLGRIAEPEEVAALIAWLCSEDCSYSTAAAFDASGGRSTY